MEASNSGAEKCLLQEQDTTEVNKQKLIRMINAVHKDIKFNARGNVETVTVKQPLGEEMYFCHVAYDVPPLHAALSPGSNMEDMLELLLMQPNIDLNILNNWNESPLVWSLRFFQRDSELSVLWLIQAGCDVNISNKNEETTLHFSVLESSAIAITHELLKRGANVNAFCSRYGTALHCAVKWGNLESVCMLLYYNADVHITWKGHTPLTLALCTDEDDDDGNYDDGNEDEANEKFKVLYDYYSIFDDDIYYLIDNAEMCFVLLKHANAEIFKRVWLKFDPKIILSRCPEFIENYLNRCMYCTLDWVECLYLILNSDIAFDLIEHCMLNTDNFFYYFLSSIQKQDVQSEDRIGLIYMVLRLGFEIKLMDINVAVALYGLNQDLEPFIYSTYVSITDDFKFICPMHAFVIGMQTDYSVKKISQLFHDALKEWISLYIRSSQCSFFETCSKDILAETYTKSVAFFSHPADVKNDIINLYANLHSKLHFLSFFIKPYITMFRERLQEIPEFPSLTELSRNQTHKYLVEKFKFKQPYQLQDCVKKLLIPNKIMDIILFKEPIY